MKLVSTELRMTRRIHMYMIRPALLTPSASNGKKTDFLKKQMPIFAAKHVACSQGWWQIHRHGSLLRRMN